MTLYAWARPRRFPELPPPTQRYFDVAPDARVLAHCHWQPRRARIRRPARSTASKDRARPTTCAASPTRRGRRGFNVVRLNQRNCGGTEHLSRGLYHSGLTATRCLSCASWRSRWAARAFAFAGYSLGGNLALKLAGDLGVEGPPRAESRLRRVAGDRARGLRARDRAPRESRLPVELRAATCRAACAARRGRFPRTGTCAGSGRSGRSAQFDERYTAPHHGFAGASDYYYRASAHARHRSHRASPRSS